MGAVKMSKKITASKIKSYFEEHWSAVESLAHRSEPALGKNYYAEGQKALRGQWHGYLAEHWGLLGKPAEELQVSRLADGKDPHTGEQLVRKQPVADPFSDEGWRRRVEGLFANARQGLRLVGADEERPELSVPLGEERARPLAEESEEEWTEILADQFIETNVEDWMRQESDASGTRFDTLFARAVERKEWSEWKVAPTIQRADAARWVVGELAAADPTERDVILAELRDYLKLPAPESRNLTEYVETLGAYARVKFADGSGGYDDQAARGWMAQQLATAEARFRPKLSAALEWYLQTKAPAAEDPNIAAYDLTIGLPKSYSEKLLVEGDQRIFDLAEKANRKALDKAQEYARVRMGGDAMPENSGKWIVAIFFHDTARPTVDKATGIKHAPNPHAHFHNVLMNMSMDSTGKIRALEPQEIFKVQRYTNAVFQAEIAFGAKQILGYQLDSHERGRATEIHGYSRKYLDAHSRRSKEINAEMEARGANGAEAHERINKALRRPKEEWDAAVLRQIWKDEAALLGQELPGIHNGGPVRALTFAERAQIADESIEYALDSLMEHQAVNDRFEVMERALYYGLGQVRVDDVEQAWIRRQAIAQKGHGAIVEIDHYRRGKPGARYTTAAMLAIERSMIDLALAGKGTMQPIADIDRDEFRERFRRRGDKNLNDQQMWLAYKAVHSRDQWMIVRGVAGAGKTSTFELVAEIAKEYSTAGYEIRGLAATSSATNNLREMGVPAETLPAHNLREVEPDAAARLYILDEGSLAGAPSVRRFAGTVRPGIDRVMIAYDPRQHQAVEAGRIVEQMEDAGVLTIKLEKIVRQASNPELLRVIELFRDSYARGENQLVLEGLRLANENGWVQEDEHKKKRVVMLAGWFLLDPERTLLIAPDNLTIEQINEAVRSELRKTDALGPDVCTARVLTGVRELRSADKRRAATYAEGDVIRWYKRSTLGGKGRVEPGEYTEVLAVDADRNRLTVRTAAGDVTFDPRAASGEVYATAERGFAVGDRIRVTRPWKQEKGETIANGALGTITALDAQGRGEIDFGGRRVAWDARSMRHILHGYASTSYSAQSLTFDRVGVHVDCGDTRLRALTDKVLGYVGFSRAAKELLVVTDDAAELCGKESPLLRHHLKPTAIPLRTQARGMSVA